MLDDEIRNISDLPTLVLGTALWGWTIERDIAFSLLSIGYDMGIRWIDTASNYPITGNMEQFGLAEKWIGIWCHTHGVNDLNVILKVGSVDNSGSPKNNLAFSYLLLLIELSFQRLGQNLRCVSVHWDDSDQLGSIQGTVNALRKLDATGMSIGLSGIRHPEVYRRAAPELADKYLIQVKENIFTHRARSKYKSHFPNADYLAYGITGGGIRLDGKYEGSSSRIVRDASPMHEAEQEIVKNSLKAIEECVGGPRNAYELTLAYLAGEPGLSGIIVAPSKTKHLEALQQYCSFSPALISVVREEIKRNLL